MPDEKGRLIDDRKTKPVLGKDRSRPLPASTRVKVVAVEIEQHYPGPLDLLEQRVEADRVETPRAVGFVEAAERRWRGRDDRVDIFRGIGRHQRKKGAERLSRQSDAAIALVFEPGYVVDEAPCTVGQGVAVARAIEAQYIPAVIAQDPEKWRRRRLGVFDRSRAAVTPDEDPHRALGAQQVLLERRIEPHSRDRHIVQNRNDEDDSRHSGQKTPPHPSFPRPLP